MFQLTYVLVPAADGPVYALWPSGYESAAHEGLLLILFGVQIDVLFGTRYISCTV
jgi:hypothetical protein